MIRNVQISEYSSGRIIKIYAIDIKIIHDFSIDTDFFDEAWIHAIYDGLVDRRERDKYEIVFSLQIPFI